MVPSTTTERPPGLVVTTTGAGELKRAVMFIGALMVTDSGLALPEASPDQLAKVKGGSLAAVNCTEAPLA